MTRRALVGIARVTYSAKKLLEEDDMPSVDKIQENIDKMSEDDRHRSGLDDFFDIGGSVGDVVRAMMAIAKEDQWEAVESVWGV